MPQILLLCQQGQTASAVVCRLHWCLRLPPLQVEALPVPFPRAFKASQPRDHLPVIRQDQSFRLYPGRYLQRLCDHAIIQLSPYRSHSLSVSSLVSLQLCPRPVMRGFTFLNRIRVAASCQFSIDCKISSMCFLSLGPETPSTLPGGCIPGFSRSAGFHPLRQQPCDHQQKRVEIQITHCHHEHTEGVNCKILLQKLNQCRARFSVVSDNVCCENLWYANGRVSRPFNDNVVALCSCSQLAHFLQKQDATFQRISTVCKHTNSTGVGNRPLHRDVLCLDIVLCCSSHQFRNQFRRENVFRRSCLFTRVPFAQAQFPVFV